MGAISLASPVLRALPHYLNKMLGMCFLTAEFCWLKDVSNSAPGHSLVIPGHPHSTFQNCSEKYGSLDTDIGASLAPERSTCELLWVVPLL